MDTWDRMYTWDRRELRNLTLIYSRVLLRIAKVSANLQMRPQHDWIELQGWAKIKSINKVARYIISSILLLLRVFAICLHIHIKSYCLIDFV